MPLAEGKEKVRVIAKHLMLSGLQMLIECHKLAMYDAVLYETTSNNLRFAQHKEHLLDWIPDGPAMPDLSLLRVAAFPAPSDWVNEGWSRGARSNPQMMKMMSKMRRMTWDATPEPGGIESLKAPRPPLRKIHLLTLAPLFFSFFWFGVASPSPCELLCPTKLLLWI